MGTCFSSTSGDGAKLVPKQPPGPFPITVAFPNCAAFTFNVQQHDSIASLRKRVVAEMERREQQGEPFAQVEGKLVTIDEETGDVTTLPETTTVLDAGLEPKQYLWFQDAAEDERITRLLLRSSRLTENTSYNSRGVKQGMQLIKDEEDGHNGLLDALSHDMAVSWN